MSPSPSLQPSETAVDLWVQRLSAAAVVAVALVLLGVGIAFYAPRAHATPANEGTAGGAMTK